MREAFEDEATAVLPEGHGVNENVVPFPRLPLPPDKGAVRITTSGAEILTECQGIVHVFGEVPGRCQCGL